MNIYRFVAFARYSSTHPKQEKKKPRMEVKEKNDFHSIIDVSRYSVLDDSNTLPLDSWVR